MRCSFDMQGRAHGGQLIGATALLAAALVAAALVLPIASRGQTAHVTAFVEGEPLTPWRKPRVTLPAPTPLNYLQLTEQGVEQAARWRRRGWYCEQLGCPGRYPMLTIWGSVRMFSAADALQIAAPSAVHRALVSRFARASERYWNPHLGGYAPYPGDRYRGVQAWFDDNGWLGLGFLNAFAVTHARRYLRDAQHAFRFIAAHGWDAAKGGGMWWNTRHPYHSGPALASDSLLGALLYQDDHEPWQLEDVKAYVDWANANDARDERQLYLEKPDEPNSVNDYVQAPLIYAQYLLCQNGEGDGYCVHAARVAATMAEQDVNAFGYQFNYGPQYDAIYMQWMMAYGQAVGDPYWATLAQVNASAAAANAVGQGRWLGSWWGGPIRDPETHSGMFRTMAATTSLFAWVAAYAKSGA